MNYEELGLMLAEFEDKNQRKKSQKDGKVGNVQLLSFIDDEEKLFELYKHHK